MGSSPLELFASFLLLIVLVMVVVMVIAVGFGT